jgi:tetratricopeptide (TPR) repeat protein
VLFRVGKAKLQDVPHLQPLRRQIMEDALEFNKQFLAAEGDSPEVRYDAAWAYKMVGEIHDDLGRTAEAEAALAEARRLFEALAAGEDQPHYRQGLALTCRSLGEVRERLGRHDQAEADFRRAAALLEALVAEQPASVPQRRNLMAAYFSLSDRLQRAGRWPEVKAVHQSLMAQYEHLARDPGADSEGALLALFGAVFRAGVTGNAPPEEQLAAVDRVVAALEARPRSPREPRSENVLGVCLRGRADLLAQLRRPSEAERDAAASVRLLAALADDFPDTAAYRQELAQSLLGHAAVLEDAGRRGDAEAACRRAVDLQAALVRQAPADQGRRVTLGELQARVGWLLMGVKPNDLARSLRAVWEGRSRPREAIEWFDRALETLGPALRPGAEGESVRGQLRGAYHGRAMAWQVWDDPAEAVKDLDRALELADERTRGPLRVSRWTAGLMVAAQERTTHADRLARLGRHAAAAAAAEPLAAGQLTGDEAYALACVYGLSASAVRRDGSLADPERVKLADGYLVRAVALLRRAQAAGHFKDPARVKHLRDDDDLAALRVPDDWTKLLAELGAPRPDGR